MTHPSSPIRTFASACLLAAICSLAACGGPVARTARYVARGQTYMEAKQFDKARVEFRNALQISPNSPQVRYLNGLVYEQLADYPHAVQYYQGALDTDKNHVDARVHLARLLLFGRAPDRAAALVDSGLQAHPDNVPMLTIRAAARAELKDLDGALVDAQRAVNLAPMDESAVGTLAGFYASGGRASEAQSLLEGLLAKQPASTDIRRILVQFYAAHGQVPKVEGLLKDLVRLQPAESTNRFELAHFFASTRRADEAEKVLRTAVAELPDNSAVRLNLVEFLVTWRGTQAAEGELVKMSAVRPADFDLQFALGRLYEQDHQAAKADALYQTIIAAQGTRAPGLTARDRLADMDVGRKDLSAAQQQIAVVLKENPRDVDALTLRSGMELGNGDARSAVADLRAVLRDRPDSVPVKRQLARAYFANGDQQLGEELLRDAVSGSGADDSARGDLAQYYVATGRPDQARPLVDELLKHNPKSLEYRQLQFQMAAGARDFNLAATAAEAIKTNYPNSAVGWYLGGRLAAVEGNLSLIHI